MALITNRKHLIAFVEGVNLWNKFLKQKTYDIKKLSKTDVQELKDKLENEMSPENLTCDGELSGKTLKMKLDKFKGAKAELETMK